MSRTSRITVSALAMLVLTALEACDVTRTESTGAASPTQAAGRKVPRLVDLGAGKCIPCKAMAPILEGLKAEYAGRMDVQFIDVWKDPDAGKAYGISIIPTQIFYGADGKELARHQGFMDKDAILAQWKAVGVSL
jgi:thioredoxin 1